VIYSKFDLGNGWEQFPTRTATAEGRISAEIGTNVLCMRRPLRKQCRRGSKRSSSARWHAGKRWWIFTLLSTAVWPVANLVWDLAGVHAADFLAEVLSRFRWPPVRAVLIVTTSLVLVGRTACRSQPAWKPRPGASRSSSLNWAASDQPGSVVQQRQQRRSAFSTRRFRMRPR